MMPDTESATFSQNYDKQKISRNAWNVAPLTLTWLSGAGNRRQDTFEEIRDQSCMVEEIRLTLISFLSTHEALVGREDWVPFV